MNAANQPNANAIPATNISESDSNDEEILEDEKEKEILDEPREADSEVVRDESAASDASAAAKQSSSRTSDEEETDAFAWFISETRQFPSVGTIVETEHAEGLAARLQQVRAFHQEDNLQLPQSTEEWFKRLSIDAAERRVSEDYFRLLQ